MLNQVIKCEVNNRLQEIPEPLFLSSECLIHRQRGEDMHLECAQLVVGALEDCGIQAALVAEVLIEQTDVVA